tara:strand:+ start:72 stop:656 length:585 start_codon:yes stop_codon:yes gene_type:complete
MTYKRYKYLNELVLKKNIKNIVEIGVYRCRTANNLIKHSLKKNDKSEINYFGFDLFENPDSDEHSKPGVPYSLEEAKKNLEKYGCNIKLFKGDTKKTLKEFVKKNKINIDLIFLDGGHSVETINSDWNNVKLLLNKNNICVFDDYYEFTDKSKADYGCNSIIDNLDKTKYSIKKLPTFDIHGTRKIHFVEVKLK